MSIPTDQRAQIARQVLVDVLKHNGPQLGAKLKVRLTAALGQRLGVAPDDWPGLVPKLSHFLAANSDLVEVRRPVGPGDIRVSLREDLAGSQADTEIRKIWYRPDVWTAFVNPDPSRRRFLHRHSGEVVHFITPASSGPNTQLAERVARDAAFIEIQFASADAQRGWLGDFLDTTPLISDANKRVARHFLQLPFDSSINAAFAASLGPHGDAWRRFRAKRVDDLVTAWAERNRIAPDMLNEGPRVSELAVSSMAQIAFPEFPDLRRAHPAPSEGARATLLRLVETLDDSDLERILVPLSAVERIFRSRS